ncbi:AraC family transcriptional regulator [Geovibrio ferrireducens]|jgi:AraC-like DNA-binding protein/mannose-6-phosphate isomerase-like protein (cupin superfamily)|uniref:AraC family transcriptional regulator n=1 Tax=Geovibrio ferrireducens TaxID=46201 RepID=UPI0022476979|nr:AraC family transcriptional regulator [Geovibrio ferrireducens]
MKQKEIRNITYDTDLNIEAYNFQGIMQKFPNHFHDYYVIGFISEGKRRMLCNNCSYIISEGDLILLNPKDNHACEQINDEPLNYKCINILPEVMQKCVSEITGSERLPVFDEPMVCRSALTPKLAELHMMIMNGENDLIKEETFLLFIARLIEEYAVKASAAANIHRSKASKLVCDYLEENYSRNISLDELSRLAGMSKFHLLRSFTRQNGISPYGYLSTVRIDKSKKMLKEGLSLVDTALETGFSDQSHFSNVFKKFTGLTPGQYMKTFSTGE